MNLKRTEIILNLIPAEFLKRQYNHATNMTRFEFENLSVYFTCFPDDTQKALVFYKDYGKHRLCSEGPAYQTWHDNGLIAEVSYYLSGVLHRPASEGPAVQRFNEHGELITNLYYENGIRINHEETFNKTGLKKNLSIT